jgi:hypothetical protein
MIRAGFAGLLVAVLGAGCQSARGGNIAQSEAAVVSPNGVSLNGPTLNGVSLNGVSLNGVSLNGVGLGEVTLNGTLFQSGSISGTGFIGASFTGTLENGSTILIRIDSISNVLSDGNVFLSESSAPSAPIVDTSASGSDIYFYGVSYFMNEVWSPLCGTLADGSPVLAIPLQGKWDSRQGVSGGGSKIDDPGYVTFACRGYALAKCVELGYRPWARSTSDVSLDSYHQACVRMIRADFCGDGRSWTLPSTPVNLYDGLEIQTDTERWNAEAEWIPSGASCISKVRVVFPNMPPCASPRGSPLPGRCMDTKHFRMGTLLMSEYQQQQKVN